MPSKGPTLSPALKQREDKQLQEKQQGSAEAFARRVLGFPLLPRDKRQLTSASVGKAHLGAERERRQQRSLLPAAKAEAYTDAQNRYLQSPLSSQRSPNWH